MNITQYGCSTSCKPFFRGKASFKSGYIVASADEFFYEFLGDNSIYPFTKLVHEDDVDDFINAVEQLNNSRQHLIIRVKNIAGEYRWMSLTMCYNNRILDGFKSFDIELIDILSINIKYSKQAVDIRKYRKFLSLSVFVFYEYDFETKNIKFYKYMNGKSIMLASYDFDELEKTAVCEEEAADFAHLKQSIITGSDMFNIELGGLNIPALKGHMLSVSGGTLYFENKRHFSVGIIQVNEDKSSRTAYYLTDAARDPATGLFNKRAIREYTVDRLYRERSNCTYIAIMDIDDFKNINDTYGHMFGDEVIFHVADILRSNIFSRGAAGRFGGDEFFLVFENVSSETELRRILKTITKQIMWLYSGTDKDLTVTTSIGISKSPDDGTTYDELFKKADRALYIAKAKGKSRFIIYDEVKHGIVHDEGNDSSIIDLSNVVKNDKRVHVISEVSAGLVKGGKVYLTYALELIRKYFDISGIRIFCGWDLNLVHVSGQYADNITAFPQDDINEFISLFDDNRVFAPTNIKEFEFKCKSVFKYCTDLNINEFVQFYSKAEEKVNFIISYDIIGKKRKWAENDVSYFTILSNIIKEILIP